MTTAGACESMAAVAVLAELRYRDGQTRGIRVPVDSSLTALIGGIHQLNEKASQLLSELVERERAGGDGEQAAGEEDEDSDGEDGEEEDAVKKELQPPAKRSKT